jgi:two-component system, NarL family, nitrate/nitrite response regulator NarL
MVCDVLGTQANLHALAYLWRKKVFQPLSRPIRLFVAESNPISSQLLAEALARDSGINVLGFSSESSELVQIVRASCVDVLLISAQMDEDPNRGLAVLRQLRKERPGLKAVVLLDSSKPAGVVEAFRSGASGVFCRRTAVDLLCKCIGAVHNGQVWANSEELGFVLAALSVAQPFQLDGRRLQPLSTREREVVHCLVEGLTNREIAQALAISQHTVKNYIFKIFDKLGVSNRVELVFQVLSRSDDISSAEAVPGKISSVARERSRSPHRDDSYMRSLPGRRETSVLHSGASRVTSQIVAKAVGE